MPSRPSSDLPTSLESLRAALAEGRRHFPGLRLGDLDGVSPGSGGLRSRGGCFKEARFGHARLAGAERGRRLLPAGPAVGRRPLRRVTPRGSFWHDADLSAARLQGADFCGALMHRCCLRGVLAADSHWRDARLVEADFRSGLDQLTDLGGADLRGADLSLPCCRAPSCTAPTFAAPASTAPALGGGQPPHADLQRLRPAGHPISEDCHAGTR